MKCVQQGRPCAKHAICIISPTSCKNDEVSVTITISILPILNLFEVVKRPTLPATWGVETCLVPRSTCHIRHSQDPSQLLNVSWAPGDTSDHSYFDSTSLRGRKCLYVPFHSPCVYLAQNRHSVSVGWRALSHGELIPSSAESRSHVLSSSPVFSRLFLCGIGVWGEVIWWWQVSVHIYTKSLVYTHACTVKSRMVRIFSQESRDFEQSASWGEELRVSSQALTCLFLKEQLSLQELSWGALSSE